jgi:DNA-binding SARP family transcriptional activator
VGKDVSVATAGSGQIELRLAGTFGVIRGGTELPEREVGSRKSRTLLKLLAVERPTLVSVDRIADVLWAGGRPAAAEHNVATLVSRLRGVLAPASSWAAGTGTAWRASPRWAWASMPPPGAASRPS